MKVGDGAFSALYVWNVQKFSSQKQPGVNNH